MFPSHDQSRKEQAALKHEHIDDEDGTYVYKRPPLEHQEQSFLLARNEEAWGHFHEQGTGKTKITLDTASYLFNKDEIDCLIVVAWPNGIHRGWIELECPKDVSVPWVGEFWSSNLTKRKRNSINDVLNAGDDKLKIMTYNIEAFVSQKAKDSILEFLNKHRCMVVIDQSAAIKNWNAKRTKFLLKEVSQKAIYRRILDGAPNAEGPEELFSQFYFLNPLIIGHDTLTAFKAEFCVIRPLERGSMIIGYKNTDELHRRIDGYCDRVLERDCQDLPPRTYLQRRFELNKDERKIYDDLKNKKAAEFKDQRLAPEHALTLQLRLGQIACGWFPDEDGDTTPISDESSRMKAFKLLLQEIGNDQAIIFSRFKLDLKALEKELGDKSCSYHGEVSEDDRAQAKIDFQNGDKQFFIGQPRNAGIGHTLTAAKWIVFYNNDPPFGS